MKPHGIDEKHILLNLFINLRVKHHNGRILFVGFPILFSLKILIVFNKQNGDLNYDSAISKKSDYSFIILRISIHL